MAKKWTVVRRRMVVDSVSVEAETAEEAYQIALDEHFFPCIDAEGGMSESVSSEEGWIDSEVFSEGKVEDGEPAYRAEGPELP